MRRIPSWLPFIAALVLALVPNVSSARGFGRGGGGGGRIHASSGSNLRKPATGRNTFSFQGNGPRSYYGPGYRGGYGYGYGAYRGYYGAGYRPGWGWGARPFWWGYYGGWGIWPWGYYAYGYYPWWGAPPLARAPDAYQEPKTDSFSLFLGGSFPSQGFAPAGSFSYDGKRWGVNFQGAGLYGPWMNGGGECFAPLLSTHLAFSLVSNPHFRWRLEAGVSSVFTPGAALVGPDVGTSAQLALVGPLGIEAAVHYTPVPESLVDIDAGVTLSFGGLGLKGGWRVIRFDDRGLSSDNVSSPQFDIFSGPSVSVGFMY